MIAELRQNLKRKRASRRSRRRAAAPAPSSLPLPSHVPLASPSPAPFHSSEGGATAAADAAVPFRTSLAALLTGHILRDGEVVMLILKPSLWFIAFASMRFLAAGLIVCIAASLWMGDSAAVSSIVYTATFVVAGRVMWAVLTWMGRLYVLTDLRVIRLSGVFNVEIFDCALRKIAATRMTQTFRERLWRLGSIEIVPADESCPPSVWQTVRRPHEVHRIIQSTIDRARQGCQPGGPE